MDETEAALLLRERRSEKERALAERGAQLDGIRSARGDADTDDEHDPEGPTLSSEWSRLAGLRDEARRELDDVADAEARLAAGGYGRCLSCGGPIPDARLRVRPEAAWCVACAERRGR